MKKLFFYVALAAAITFTACGKKSGVPEPIQAIAAEMEQKMAEDGDEGITFESVTIEDHDIVCKAILDESQFGGMSFKDAFSIIGLTEETFSEMMREGMFDIEDKKDAEDIAALREYEYNIVIRMVGSVSEDEMNFIIKHEDLPEVNPADFE